MSFREDYSKENAQSQQFMSFTSENCKENAQSRQFMSFLAENYKENALAPRLPLEGKPGYNVPLAHRNSGDGAPNALTDKKHKAGKPLPCIVGNIFFSMSENFN